GALDFGVIVDGAVVIVEAIALKMTAETVYRRSTSGKYRVAAAVKQVAPPLKTGPPPPVTEVARPTFFSLLIIIAASLPIFLLQRVEGRIFAPMAHTVVAALLGGLVLSITLVPVLATFAYGKPRKHRESPVLRAATAAYLPTLRG